jgi:hypothetical protein
LIFDTISKVPKKGDTKGLASWTTPLSMCVIASVAFFAFGAREKPTQD